MRDDTLELTLTVEDAAKVLGLGRTTMYELARTKGFPVVTVGRRKLISRQGLERWIQENEGREVL